MYIKIYHRPRKQKTPLPGGGLSFHFLLNFPMPIAALNNINIYYNITGNGAPILFLHGLGSQGLDWEAKSAFFQAAYQCILPDMRGHGQSDKPDEIYTIHQMADDIIKLLVALHTTSVHIVSISMGGSVAFQLADARPDLVQSMVIINSVSDWRMKTLKDKLKLWQRMMIVRFMGMRKMGAVLAARLLPKPEHESLREEFIEKWALNDTQAYLNSLKALTKWSLPAKRLAAITTPTLFIVSDNDYSPIKKKRKIVSQMQNAKLVVIEDARHAVTVEYPEQVNKAIETFLNHLD